MTVVQNINEIYNTFLSKILRINNRSIIDISLDFYDPHDIKCDVIIYYTEDEKEFQDEYTLDKEQSMVLYNELKQRINIPDFTQEFKIEFDWNAVPYAYCEYIPQQINKIEYEGPIL